MRATRPELEVLAHARAVVIGTISWAGEDDPGMDGAGSEIGGGVPDEKGGERHPRENRRPAGSAPLFLLAACPAKSLTAVHGAAKIHGDQARRGQRLGRNLRLAAGALTRMTLPELPRKGNQSRALSLKTSTAPKARGSRRRKLGTVRNPRTASAWRRRDEIMRPLRVKSGGSLMTCGAKLMI